jgi:hypothetical protein
VFQRIFYELLLRFRSIDSLRTELRSARHMRIQWAEDSVYAELARRGVIELAPSAVCSAVEVWS